VKREIEDGVQWFGITPEFEGVNAETPKERHERKTVQVVFLCSVEELS
jgi:hypothetical protein